MHDHNNTYYCGYSYHNNTYYHKPEARSLRRPRHGGRPGRRPRSPWAARAAARPGAAPAKVVANKHDPG